MPAPRSTDTKPEDNSPAADRKPETDVAGQLDPQRVVIEQAPAEPAVFYGPEGGQVPGSHAATDPNKPHTKADYQPFEW